MWCGVVWFGFGSAWAGLFHDRGDHDHERDNDNDDHHHPVSVPPSTSFNCHRPQACQERDARDRWIVNALMSESRLEVS